ARQLLAEPSPALALSPAADPLRHSLASIAGIDLEAGLIIARGKLDRYAHLLNMFVEHNSAYGQRIVAHLNEGDAGIDASGRLAHSLKGICSTLGMTEISGLAAQLDEGCKQGRPAVDLLPTATVLARAIDDLTVAIRQHARP
ncbi:MAG TPA: Hpt domain-containing protein, partial [Rhodocyclaceae bacterium]|nr:Hpt domain-containing protein [Rhodocyclaceae bacterium]